MSLNVLENLTEPLTLNGPVTVNKDFFGKDVYVTGTLTGSGIGTDIFGTANTWTKTNDFQNVTSYTGGVPQYQDDQILTKGNIDTTVGTVYQPLNEDNIWLQGGTFTNVTVPSVPVQGTSVADLSLIGALDIQQVITDGNNPPPVLATNNIWSSAAVTASGAFGVDPAIPSLLVPVAGNDGASKAYADGATEIAGNTLTYTIDVPGSYNFIAINQANFVRMDYALFGGGNTTHSGAYCSGTMGNGCGGYLNLNVVVGTLGDTTHSYTDPSLVPTNTVLSVSGNGMVRAGGAGLINGISTAGVATQTNGSGGIQADGLLGTNVFSDGALGTISSTGGAILVAYFL